jgi:hypothetical protein
MMFHRAAAPDGFTKQQMRMLRRYETLGRKLYSANANMADLVALDSQPKRQLTEFAEALDSYGTRTQRAYFIDLHQTTVRSIMALSLQDKEGVRLALCREAVSGWPSMQRFPAFVETEPGLRSQWGDGYDRGDFIKPDGANFDVAILIWVGAYGGPAPVSLLDMSKSMACVEALVWLEHAVAKFDFRVNEIMRARRTLL